jgi:hypothetical protein
MKVRLFILILLHLQAYFAPNILIGKCLNLTESSNHAKVNKTFDFCIYLNLFFKIKYFIRSYFRFLLGYTFNI